MPSTSPPDYYYTYAQPKELSNGNTLAYEGLPYLPLIGPGLRNGYVDFEQWGSDNAAIGNSMNARIDAWSYGRNYLKQLGNHSECPPWIGEDNRFVDYDGAHGENYLYYVNSGSCSPFISSPGNVDVAIHESGHAFGLDDHYTQATDPSCMQGGQNTIALSSHGPWCAGCREFLGWIKGPLGECPEGADLYSGSPSAIYVAPTSSNKATVTLYNLDDPSLDPIDPYVAQPITLLGRTVLLKIPLADVMTFNGTSQSAPTRVAEYKRLFAYVEMRVWGGVPTVQIRKQTPPWFQLAEGVRTRAFYKAQLRTTYLAGLTAANQTYTGNYTAKFYKGFTLSDEIFRTWTLTVDRVDTSTAVVTVQFSS